MKFKALFLIAIILIAGLILYRPEVSSAQVVTETTVFFEGTDMPTYRFQPIIIFGEDYTQLGVKIFYGTSMYAWYFPVGMARIDTGGKDNWDPFVGAGFFSWFRGPYNRETGSPFFDINGTYKFGDFSSAFGSGSLGYAKGLTENIDGYVGGSVNYVNLLDVGQPAPPAPEVEDQFWSAGPFAGLKIAASPEVGFRIQVGHYFSLTDGGDDLTYYSANVVLTY